MLSKRFVIVVSMLSFSLLQVCACGERSTAEQLKILSETPIAAVRPAKRQIILHTRLLELSLNKHQKRRLDSGSESESKSSDLIRRLLATRMVPKSIPQLIDVFEQHGDIRVLADPTIATIDRQIATMKTGGMITTEHLANVQDQTNEIFIGTRLRVVPQVVSDKKLYVEVHIRASSLQDQHEPSGKEIPRCQMRAIDTTLEATFGETSIVSGLVNKTERGDQVEKMHLVLLVTPEWADGEHALEPRTVHDSTTQASDSRKK